MSLVPRSPQIPFNIPSEQCCKYNCHLANVGDGNMHTDWLHTQLTQPLECNGGTCTASYTETYSISYSLSANINVGFFSGGFSVTESWSEGEGYSCAAKEGERVCVWMAVGHAAYTVQPNLDGYPPICDWNGQLIVRSPLKNNPGGGFYCVRGDGCRAINDNYWCNGQKDIC